MMGPLALGLLLVTLPATAWAVSCYACDSVNDSNCGDHFIPDDIATMDCDSMELPEESRAIYLQRPETACLTKYYKGSPEEELFVRRSCAYSDLAVCDEKPDPVVPHLNFLGCVFCHQDKCNASNKLNRSFTLAFVLSLLLLLRN